MFSRLTLLSSLPIPGDMSNEWNISPDAVRNYNRPPSHPVTIAATALECTPRHAIGCLDASVQGRDEVRRIDGDINAIGKADAAAIELGNSGGGHSNIVVAI